MKKENIFQYVLRKLKYIYKEPIGAIWRSIRDFKILRNIDKPISVQPILIHRLNLIHQVDINEYPCLDRLISLMENDPKWEKRSFNSLELHKLLGYKRTFQHIKVVKKLNGTFDVIDGNGRVAALKDYYGDKRIFVTCAIYKGR